MNLSKLSASEKLAVYGAVATVIGAAVAASSWPGHWGVTWLGAAGWIGALLLWQQAVCGCSFPAPIAPEETYTFSDAKKT